MGCVTDSGWSSFSYPVHCLYWWLTDWAWETRGWLLLEQTLCWCCLLCWWHCSLSAISFAWCLILALLLRPLIAYCLRLNLFISHTLLVLHFVLLLVFSSVVQSSTCVIQPSTWHRRRKQFEREGAKVVWQSARFARGRNFSPAH
jgi:hypothetical protein